MEALHDDGFILDNEEERLVYHDCVIFIKINFIYFNKDYLPYTENKTIAKTTSDQSGSKFHFLVLK